ncbi:MAG: cupin domain-containing protein [Gammaproteobacteria bacterium]|nr:cupin domain-containing protein [Gammaproteobacteria bacterium]
MPDVRAVFSRPEVATPENHRWVPSPQAGVERVMLDRLGDEVAVATSLVRYAPGSTFPDHDHALGEEYIVLEGEFGDEHGRYPVGTYVRNPAGTHHAPFSEPGCVIFVKLRQFDPVDQRQCVIALDATSPAEGWRATELHRHAGEVVQEIVAAADAELELPAAEYVQEVLVLNGQVVWEDQELGANGWIRVPVGSPLRLTARVASHLFHKTRPDYASPATGR